MDGRRDGEEGDFLVVPVGQDLARGGEDVGRAALEELACAQRQHRQELERGAELGQAVDLLHLLGLCPREHGFH